MLLGNHPSSGATTRRLRDSHPLRSAFPNGSSTPAHSHQTRTVILVRNNPTTPAMQHSLAITHGSGLASSAFARHYSRNHMLFSLPAGTEMFHFPAFPPHSLCVQLRVTTHNRQPGFPIRTSWDQSSVINSPRLIADSHVLHRLLMPRHPPCALKNLATQKPHNMQNMSCKMLASTMQFSNNNPITTTHTNTPHTGTHQCFEWLGTTRNTTPPPPQRGDGPVVSGPNSVSTTPAPPQPRTRSNHPPEDDAAY